jgi:hypothetical protein
MTVQNVRVQTGKREAQPTEAAHAEEGGGSLVDQAKGYGAVAREAHAECAKGADADKELAARKNSSAQ